MQQIWILKQPFETSLITQSNNPNWIANCFLISSFSIEFSFKPNFWIFHFFFFSANFCMKFSKILTIFMTFPTNKCCASYLILNYPHNFFLRNFKQSNWWHGDSIEWNTQYIDIDCFFILWAFLVFLWTRRTLLLLLCG